jgi:hypothetical protein
MHEMLYVKQIIGNYYSNKKMCHNIPWLKQLDLADPNFERLSYFITDKAKEYYKTNDYERDEVPKLINILEVNRLAVEMHQWFLKRYIQLEEDIISKINNWQNREYRDTSYHSNTRDDSYLHQFMDNHGINFNKDIYYCHGLFLLCFVKDIPYMMYNVYITHHAHLSEKVLKNPVHKDDQHMMEIKPKLNYDRILKSFSHRSLILFGYSHGCETMFYVYNCLLFQNDTDVLNIIKKYVMDNVPENEIYEYEKHITGYMDSRLIHILEGVIRITKLKRTSKISDLSIVNQKYNNDIAPRIDDSMIHILDTINRDGQMIIPDNNYCYNTYIKFDTFIKQLSEADSDVMQIIKDSKVVDSKKQNQLYINQIPSIMNQVTSKLINVIADYDKQIDKMENLLDNLNNRKDIPD